MRTTVDLNDSLVVRVRRLMTKRKTSMRALIEEGLRRVLAEETHAHRQFKLREASVTGDGLVEGVPDLSWDTMRRHLYPHG